MLASVPQGCSICRLHLSQAPNAYFLLPLTRSATLSAPMTRPPALGANRAIRRP